MSLKDRQICVRVLPETYAWLERRAGGQSKKADFVRGLIEGEMARDREENLLRVFNKAAADVTESDRAEREALLGTTPLSRKKRRPGLKPSEREQEERASRAFISSTLPKR